MDAGIVNNLSIFLIGVDEGTTLRPKPPYFSYDSIVTDGEIDPPLATTHARKFAILSSSVFLLNGCAFRWNNFKMNFGVGS